jgi:hypothetical protein
MKTDLQRLGYLPTVSPYADAREVNPLPADIVDWMYIELRETATGPAVAARSAFVRNDGVLVDDDGSAVVLIPGQDEGAYYVVVRHRNQLAIMSADAISLSWAISAQCDFTTAQSRAYGTNPMKDLGDGSYGMISGDADGNGAIGAGDRGLIWNKRLALGYEAGDVDLSGSIGAADRGIGWNNRLRMTGVPN